MRRGGSPVAQPDAEVYTSQSSASLGDTPLRRVIRRGRLGAVEAFRREAGCSALTCPVTGKLPGQRGFSAG